MTLDEAKEVFLNRGFINGFFDGDKWRQSIIVISEWLVQEPCEDTISRQAAIDLVSIMYLGNDSNSSYRTDGDTGDTLVGKFQVIDGLSDLPAVTPRPKTGHWIYTLEDWNKWECSNCGYTKRTDVHVSIGYKYCPECGARMIKEVKE